MQPSPSLEPSRRHRTVALLGHPGHGKSQLAIALSDRCSADPMRPWSLKTLPISYLDLATPLGRSGAPQDSRGTKLSVVRVESPAYHNFLIDECGSRARIHEAISACAVSDGAVLVVSALKGPASQTREHALIAYAMGMRSIVVLITHCDLVEDPAYIDLVELETREVLNDAGFDGDATPFVRAAPKLHSPLESQWNASLDDLVDTIDRAIAPSVYEQQGDATAVVLERFERQTYGSQAVVLLAIRRGKLSVGQQLRQRARDGSEVVYLVDGLRVMNEPVASVAAGDICTVSMKRPEIPRVKWQPRESYRVRRELRRGRVLHVNPEPELVTTVTSSVAVIQQARGGRHTPIVTGHRGALYLGATRVVATVTLPEGCVSLAPGEQVADATLTFDSPVDLLHASWVLRDGTDGLQRRFAGLPAWSGTALTGTIMR
ncbi:MAG: GTP-binding protein [Deltaproteobacteria bacterium]|nr:GTP-binding protein [Deltaproteobacteria bacterium]